MIMPDSASQKKQREDIRPHDSFKVPRYADVATFVRAPRTDDIESADVAVFGVPTDQGLSFRTGTRHGPAAIREASRFIRRYNPTTRISPFERLNVIDAGDVEVPPYSLEGMLDNTEAFTRRVVAAGGRPIAIGGDHVVAMAVVRGVSPGTPIGLLHVDAHPDTNDTFYGHRYNHATVFRRLHEEHLLEPSRVVQLGMRGTQFSALDEEYGLNAGFEVINYDRYEELGRAEVIARLKSTFGSMPTYISIDVDGLDPRDTPGTPVVEPGGLSMRDMQVILRSLTGMHLIGADICEVSPQLDPSGMTAVNAANLLFELLCLMASGPTT
jgi:guanidinopropionase